jgi:hypothetical protein
MFREMEAVKGGEENVGVNGGAGLNRSKIKKG